MVSEGLHQSEIRVEAFGQLQNIGMKCLPRPRQDAPVDAVTEPEAGLGPMLQKVEHHRRFGAAIADQPQVADEFFQGRHAISWEKALSVGDGVPRRIGGVVVEVQDVHRRAAEQLQAGQGGTTFIKVIDVEQHAGLGMGALDGDVHNLAQTAQGLGKAP